MLLFAKKPVVPSYAVVAHGTNYVAYGNSTVTLNTTGASLIIFMLQQYTGYTGVPSDSQGNTWILVRPRVSFGVSQVDLFYCAAPKVGASHSFSVGSGCAYGGPNIAAFSGVSTVSPLDQVNFNTVGGSINSMSPGSITPGQSNELVVCTWNGGQNCASATVDSGFQITDQRDQVANNAIGFAISWKTSSAAVNPTWTYVNNYDAVASIIVSFRGA